MFASKPRTRFATAIRVLLIAVILFNALTPTAALASRASGQEQNAEFAAGSALQQSRPAQEGKKAGRVSGEPVSTSNLMQTDSGAALPSERAAKAPSLSLVSEPDYLTPNTALTLTWTIENVSLQDYPVQQLQITIPEGLSLQPGYPGTYDEATRVLTVPVTALSGQVGLTTGQTVADAEVRAVLSDTTQSIADAILLLPVHEQYLVTQQGGEIVTSDGKIKIKIPADTFKKDTYIEIGKPSKKALPAYSLSGQPFEIKAKDKKSRTDLHQFDQKIEIEVSYADLNIPDKKLLNLFLYWYNPETQEWEAMLSSADPLTKTIKGKTDHFTVFDIGLNNWQAAHTPTVDDFQVSQFTGAATFSLPMEVPAGPGGLQPSLALSYNSQVVDQSTFETQASWVGMGWSLEIGSIEKNTGGSAHSFDDTYFLNVGGVSARLVLDNAGVWHAADENFWRFDYDSTAKTWTVWDKTGTKGS